MKFVLPFLLALSAPVFAQAGQPTVMLRALCFSHQNGIEKVEVGVPGSTAKGVEIPLFLSAVSEPKEVMTDNNILRFCHRSTPPEGAESLKLVAEARSLGVKRQLAIFFPTGDEAKPYTVHIIDDSEKQFPMGTSLAINLSSKPFVYSIGEHRARVGPGKTVSVPMATQTNDRGQVSVIIGVEKDGAVEPVNQTRWFTGEDKRDIIISFIHPETGQPTVNCYQDRPPWLFALPAVPP